MTRKISQLQTILLLMALLTTIGLVACKKYVDPATPDIELTNYYCNDPIAANYNRGFPGIPDSTVCEYATEYFEGTWLWIDSVFDEELNFQEAHTRNLVFTPYSLDTDTLRHKLTVTGLCDNATLLQLTANKYALALTDTLLPNTSGGQQYCAGNDTVSGFFKRTTDTLIASMNITLTENNTTGLFYHKGLAVKQ